MRMIDLEHGIEARREVGEFFRLARLRMEAKDSVAYLKQLDPLARRIPERIQKIIAKAEPGMITAPGGSPATWGGEQLTYDSLATSFLESLTNTNIFDAAVPFMKRVPLKTKVAMSMVAATAVIIAEGAAKQLSELDFSDQALEPVKAAALIVVTNDLLKLGGAIAAQLFNAELTSGVAKATDAYFVNTLIAETTPTASSGDFLADLATVLGSIDGGANSRYFVAVEPGTLKVLVTLPGAVGRAFPELTLNGGSVGGVTIVASDGLDTGEMLAFDATQIAADPGTIRLDASKNATLDMAGGNAPSFDLFQKNASALRAERLFGFKLLRATAAASISGAEYGGSP